MHAGVLVSTTARAAIAAFVIGGVALAFRLWHLGARSVWTDEATLWTAARAPFGEMLRLCAQKDLSPPLFTMLTGLALRLGETEASLRLVSALASAGLVWITYRLARLGASRADAALAAMLAAISPFQLMYAQEARTYMLAAFLMTAALYLFARAMHQGTRHHWPAFALVSALALYTQQMAVLGVGVQAAIVLFTAEGRRQMRPWLSAQAGAFALYLPWVLVAHEQSGRLLNSHWYIRHPDLHSISVVLRNLFVSPLPLITPVRGAALPGLGAMLPRPLAWALLLAIVLVPLGSALRSLPERTQRGALVRLTFGALALPLLAVLGVSFWKSLWLARFFVFVTPMIAILYALGITGLSSPALRRVWACALLALSAYACFRYDTDYTKEPWRNVVNTVAAESAGDEAGEAVLVPFDADPFAFYSHRLAPTLPVFEVSHPDEPFSARFTLEEIDEMARQAENRVEGVPEVWLVVRSPNSLVRREVIRRVEEVVRAEHPREDWREFDSAGGPVWLARFRT